MNVWFRVVGFKMAVVLLYLNSSSLIHQTLGPLLPGDGVSNVGSLEGLFPESSWEHYEIKQQKGVLNLNGMLLWMFCYLKQRYKIEVHTQRLSIIRVWIQRQAPHGGFTNPCCCLKQITSKLWLAAGGVGLWLLPYYQLCQNPELPFSFELERRQSQRKCWIYLLLLFCHRMTWQISTTH